MKQKYSLFLLALLLCAAASASNLRQISSREGISNNAILSLAQDRHGFIWVGSCDGLNMWDGERMRLFPDDWNGDASLSGNLIEEIAVTADSLFWIRTNYGLDLFDPGSKRVEPHSNFEGMYKIVTRRSNEAIVVTQENKYSYYDRAQHLFRPAKAPLPGMDYADILTMQIDPAGTLWLYTRKGIFHLPVEFPTDGSEVRFGSPTRLATAANPSYAFVDGDRICFIDERHTFYEFDTDSRQLVYRKDMREEIARMGSVSSIVGDGSDYLVSFYTNGVIRLRATPEQRVKYVAEHINVSCGVFSLLRDARQDIVWIGTDGQGLYQHTRNAFAFRSITFNELPFNLSKPVRALYVDQNQTLWAGTKGEGILRIEDFYSHKTFDMRRATHLTTGNSQLLDNSVYAFAASSRNLLWIGTDGQGLNYYSYREGRVRTLNTPEPLKYIHAMYESSPDTLWVATVGCGVFLVTLGGTSDQPTIRTVEPIYFNDELQIKTFFFSLYPENSSVIWFGNRGGGAVRYNTDTGLNQVVRFDHEHSAIANDIFAIHRSNDGDMWFGTSGGLIRYSNDTSTLVSGIASTVHTILEDRRGNLWLGTNRGLVQYSPRTGYVVSYGYSYGQNIIEYSDGACFADPRTNVLLFGGINGLTTVDATGFEERPYNPPILFRDVRINSGIRDIGDMLSPEGVLTLRHGQHIPGINVSALDYINGSNYTYYSRISGLNNQWSATPPQLSFGDLPAGSYRLDVRYRNNITGTTSPVFSLPIYISPPWYATVTAIFIYALLALAVIGISIRLYLMRYRRRRDEKLQRLETQRKEEVYESKLHFFSDITQELSMPLTMISAPCQQIIAHSGSDPYVLRQAQTIRQNVSKLHDLTYLLHEFRGSRTAQEGGSGNIELIPVAEIAYSMLGTFSEYSQQNNIHSNVDIEQNLAWPTDRDSFSTIINTLLSNAFKHTPYNGTVNLTMRNDEGRLLLSVSNDSAGINLEDIEAIFDHYRVLDYFEHKSGRGLSFQGDMRLAICHSIIVRMGGEIAVESSPNAQTTFTVRLPRLKVTDETAQPNGNIVPIATDYGLLPTTPRSEFTFDPGRRTMFIVNDNSEVMNFVAELFAADYNIMMAAGMSGITELLKQTHPDIVICDALSEQSDNLSVIRFIKDGKLTSHIPVILLSTARQIDERIKGVESGADICLTLPFNVEYLKAVAGQLLKRNRSLKDYYKSSISAFELSDGRMLHQDDKEFIDRMLVIINDNITSPEISTKFIADELGVSVRNLYRRLAGIFNQTPTNIIKEYRLAKAEQLLSSTKLSIDEIIYKAGFANRGTFFKCFATKYGCTPKAYRTARLSQIPGHTGEQ